MPRTDDTFAGRLRSLRAAAGRRTDPSWSTVRALADALAVSTEGLRPATRA